MYIFMNISMLMHGYEISQTDCFATVWLYPFCEDACEAPYYDIGYGRVVCGVIGSCCFW